MNYKELFHFIQNNDEFSYFGDRCKLIFKVQYQDFYFFYFHNYHWDNTFLIDLKDSESYENITFIKHLNKNVIYGYEVFSEYIYVYSLNIKLLLHS
jgi:hypothetical protein